MHVLCMYTSTNLHMLAHLAAGGQLPQRDEAAATRLECMLHRRCYNTPRVHAHLAAGGQLPQRDEARDVNEHELKEAGIHQRCHQGLLVEYFALHARLLHVQSVNSVPSKCEFYFIKV